MKEMKAQRPNRVRGRGAALEAIDAAAVHRLVAAAKRRGGARVARAGVRPAAVEATLAAVRLQLATRGASSERR
jgi:hypothetical protein